MKIDGGKLESIEEKLVRFVDAQPPRALYTALLALVDPEQHVASWTEWDPEPDTHWRSWFVTDTAIAFVHLRFDQSNWYRGREEDAYSREKFIPTNVVAAWVRPLASVYEISILEFGTPLGPNRSEVPLGSVRLRFRDGFTADLPTQTSLHTSERPALDAFTESVKARVNHWS